MFILVPFVAFDINAHQRHGTQHELSKVTSWTKKKQCVFTVIPGPMTPPHGAECDNCEHLKSLLNAQLAQMSEQQQLLFSKRRTLKKSM